jgi:hypothetical protein
LVILEDFFGEILVEKLLWARSVGTMSLEVAGKRLGYGVRAGAGLARNGDGQQFIRSERASQHRGGRAGGADLRSDEWGAFIQSDLCIHDVPPI